MTVPDIERAGRHLRLAEEGFRDRGGTFGVYSRQRWRAHLRESSLRYRLLVAAGTAAEAIRYSGGLLFDACAAGWEVIVATPDPRGLRGLELLGAIVMNPGSDPAPLLHEVNPHVLVLADVWPAMALNAPPTVLWTTNHTGLHRAQHPLSLAGTAFKQHALRAAALDEPASTAETFWSNRRGRHRGLPRSLGLTFTGPAPG
ncbi:hypothetical protein [Nocardia jiangsuensis]|uniref:Uncharacterized protein n=1 Tax=Nocardia jiangsuensis TaxID=1691563 RepID=A0ABV8DZI4_9NOCA